MNKAYFGGGCFWCVEAVYLRVKGVNKVVSGYAGGEEENPTYRQLPSTSHAEVIEVAFAPDKISYEKLLEIFWHVHDPTTPNRQGNDVGKQYRSIILYTDDKQKAIAQKSLNEVARKLWSDPVVTELKKLNKFYPAEDYHQDYFNHNPSNSYCQIIINPKIAKFEKTFFEYLK